MNSQPQSCHREVIRRALSKSLWIFFKYQRFCIILHICKYTELRLCSSHLNSKKKILFFFLSNRDRLESWIMELNTGWNLWPLWLKPWEYCHRCATRHGSDWNKMLKTLYYTPNEICMPQRCALDEWSWSKFRLVDQLLKNKNKGVPTLQLYLLLPFQPGETSGVILSSSRLKSSRAWTTSSWYWDTTLASDWAALTWTNTRDM